jgi:hypothetical protein
MTSIPTPSFRPQKQCVGHLLSTGSSAEGLGSRCRVRRPTMVEGLRVFFTNVVMTPRSAAEGGPMLVVNVPGRRAQRLQWLVTSRWDYSLSRG